jgi:uncharacterized OB-fold protein
VTARPSAGLPLIDDRLFWGDDAAAHDHNLVPGARAGLAASRCSVCSLPFFPVRSECERCGAATVALELRRGELVAVTEVIHPPPGAELAVPYSVGYVAFDEGLAVLGLLEEQSLHLLKIGDRVEVVATDAVPGVLTYAFRRAAGPARER